MTTKPKKSAPPQKLAPVGPISITGCMFEVQPATNKKTAAAVVMLARAAEANAKAIEAAAKALSGPDAPISGLSITQARS